MSNTARYILYIIGLLVIGFLIWYFNNIVIYIIASLIMALMGRPFFDILEKVKFRKFHLPSGIRAIITLVVLIILILLFFGLFIPLIVSKVHELSVIDPQTILNKLQEPIEKLDQLINKYKLQPESNFSVEELTQRLIARINIGQVAGVFKSVASWLGNFSVAVGSIIFITFFFLKDERLFSRMILSMVPDNHTHAVSKAMNASRNLLSRYFVGVFVEVTTVLVLSTIGLLLIGFPFKDALLVGFIAGIFNIIPYLGPIMGTFFGLLIGIVTALSQSGERNILLLAVLIISVFIIVQFVDNMMVQPYVYSSSVKAHPLEIFIVFLMAGSLGGLAGMILAVPIYTVMRVFAKEFFNNFKLVRSLTKNI